MPESLPSSPEARCFALEEFFRNQDGPESSKTRCQSRRMTPSIHIDCGNHHPKLAPLKVRTSPGTSDSNGRTKQRGRGARTNPKENNDPPQSGGGRKPGTSQYYGVRFRPDLNKWVAEIRVAEWKAVDKKVWLGTFETERAAARGVDLARKLLKCTKKHPPNLPCESLRAYSKQIPPHLILTDLTATTMFKSTTLFIKRECKEYAASFDDPAQSITPGTSGSSSSHTGALEYEFNTGATGSSDVLDLEESSESDFSDMIHGYYNDDVMAFNDQHTSGLEVDSYSTMTNYTSNYEVGMSSSPSSCTSPASCVTLEAWQGHEMVPEMVPEMMEGMSMMETTLAEHMDVGAASQQWADDASLFPSWPVLQQDSTPCCSGFFTQLPDSLSGLTSYMSPMHGGYIAPLDLDPWSFQGVHNYPFQHGPGPNGWY